MHTRDKEERPRHTAPTQSKKQKDADNSMQIRDEEERPNAAAPAQREGEEEKSAASCMAARYVGGQSDVLGPRRRGDTTLAISSPV